jgi:hypothetical protein
MTIEECLDIADPNGVFSYTMRNQLRAAILALLDSEAEACAAEIEGDWWRRGPECAESIRARIAARKVAP